MKKDIYIIRNDINNKIYIGQAKTTSLRWSGHKRCHGGFIEIDKAMAKLGIEHFTCEVIEKQIENYSILLDSIANKFERFFTSKPS